MPQEPYRCADCVDFVNRCDPCRARRRAAVNARRAQRRTAKVCPDCGRKRVPGFTRCKLHLAQNARISLASHAKARAEKNQ